MPPKRRLMYDAAGWGPQEMHNHGKQPMACRAVAQILTTHPCEDTMHLFRSVGAIVGLSCVLPQVAASQVDSRPAEVQRLQFYVGRWDETGQMRDDPSKAFQPIAGGETCKWSAGGYAVLCEEKTEGAGGGWDGVYILSYDAAGAQYHVYGTEKPGNNMHGVGRLDGNRWIWVTDPAPDGSQVRYTFVPAGTGARTLTVEVGAGERWAEIVNIKYTLRN